MINSFVYMDQEVLYNPDRQIAEFRGPHFFLSNFFPLAPPFNQIYRDGCEFKSSEHAYMAFKAKDDPELKHKIIDAPTAAEAKRLGKLAKLPDDWDERKFDLMYWCVSKKFGVNPILANSLVRTGYAHLIEGNTWGDRIWGMTLTPEGPTVGENHLGKILMVIREQLRTRL